MLGQKFPKTQFVITGVLGPDSNAHGPNEMLHIDMAQKVTCCVANIVVDHYNEFAKQKSILQLHFQLSTLSKKQKTMPVPGIEPGSLVPQTKILTTKLNGLVGEGIFENHDPG